MPSSFIFRTNQGKLQYSNTYYLLGTPPPVTINSVVASASPYTYPVTAADVSGTSITNGINYKVLSFASVSTTTTYTVNYTCASATTIYVLAVGGGGSGGYGGANTGSGGGGGISGRSLGNAGGSGIVMIAFPSASAVTSNQSAVLPASIVSSGLYSATLNNATLTSLAYNTIKCAYACRLLNYNYFGPIMTLRHNLDTTGINTKNFYSDICGNLGTGYMGTGQSVSTWLSGNGANTTYAFVTKWYNQGMDVSFNCATQYTTTLQPVYDVSNGLLNFGYTTAGTWVTAPQTGCYFNLPNASFPIGDASLTFVTKVYNSTGYGTLYNQGPATANKNTVAFVTGGNYIVSHMGNDFSTSSSFTANNVVSYTYAGNNGIQKWYKNGTNAASYTAPAAYDISSSYSYIANSPNSGTGAIQMYYLNVFSSVLNDNDRQIMEATPYSYSVLPSITGLATSSTTTTFVLSWTTVANAKSHVLWINGSAFQTYGEVITTGTITPGVSGAWNINLYAYSATNVLLATRYSIAQIPSNVSNNDLFSLISLNIFIKSIFLFFVVKIHTNVIINGKTSFENDIYVSFSSLVLSLISSIVAIISPSFELIMPGFNDCISSSSSFKYNFIFAFFSIDFVNALLILV